MGLYARSDKRMNRNAAMLGLFAVSFLNIMKFSDVNLIEFLPFNELIYVALNTVFLWWVMAGIFYRHVS